MLTTTYSIMLLDAEQQKARGFLARLEQHLHTRPRTDCEEIDTGWLRDGVVKLMAAYSFTYERKIELYVIPSLRKTPRDAQALLDAIDTMDDYVTRILEYVYKQFQRAVDGVCIDLETLQGTMQLFCRQMLERFLIEEQKLLPLARQLLSEDDWFDIASRCLTHAKTGRGRCAGGLQQPVIAQRYGDQRVLH